LSVFDFIQLHEFVKDTNSIASGSLNPARKFVDLIICIREMEDEVETLFLERQGDFSQAEFSFLYRELIFPDYPARSLSLSHA